MNTQPPQTATLIVTIGAPAAGKTTWRHRWLRPDVQVVSLDDNRARLSCCSANQRATGRAVRMATADARRVLGEGGTVLWDATSAKRADRQQLLRLAADYQATTHAVLFLPPLDTVLTRNARRNPKPCPACGYARRVPDNVILRMHHAIVDDLATLNAEGWQVITQAYTHEHA